MQGLLFSLHTGRQRGVSGHVIEKSSQTFNRQQHQIVQTQAWQCFQLAARPRRALWQKAFVSRHGGQGTGMAADPFLQFEVQTPRSGELVLVWSDDSGEKGQARAQIEVKT